MDSEHEKPRDPLDEIMRDPVAKWLLVAMLTPWALIAVATVAALIVQIPR